MKTRPQTGEFAPYFQRYVTLVPEGDIASILETQLAETLALLGSVSEEQAAYRYAEGKWSIKEVLGHVTDNERMWTYRLVRIARGGGYAFPGYEPDPFVQEAQFDRSSLRDLLDAFTHVRRSTILLLRSIPDEAWERSGELRDSRLTARAAACIIAGHETHHRNILKERYLPHLPHLTA